MWEDNPVTGGGDLIGTSFLHSSINAVIVDHSVLDLLSALIIILGDIISTGSNTLIILETTEVGRFKSSGRSAILEVISASDSLYLHRNINVQGLLSLLQMCLREVEKPRPRYH